MSEDDRLTRALAGASPQGVDPMFVLQVMRRAEERRYRSAQIAGVLRGAAVAAAGSSLIILLAGWLAENTEPVLIAGAVASGVLALNAAARAARVLR